MDRKKILGLNVLILAGYMIVLTIVLNRNILIAAVLPIAIHFMSNIILFFGHIYSDRHKGLTYLLSAFLVLLIGFPSCWSISGGIFK